MNLEDLAKPFPAKDIQWLPQGKPKKGYNGVYMVVNAFLRNRAVQDRLDAVCGPGRWQNAFKPGPDGGVICGISIYIGADFGWVTKWDGAANSHRTDKAGKPVEEPHADMPIKGGLSNAMKRAGVQWGIGRYLYELPKTYAKFGSGPNSVNFEGEWLEWSPPVMPKEFLPSGDKTEHVVTQEDAVVEEERPTAEPEPAEDPAALDKSALVQALESEVWTERMKAMWREVYKKLDTEALVDIAARLATMMANDRFTNKDRVDFTLQMESQPVTIDALTNIAEQWASEKKE
jgi:hypothetical protein